MWSNVNVAIEMLVDYEDDRSFDQAEAVKYVCDMMCRNNNFGLQPFIRLLAHGTPLRANIFVIVLGDVVEVVM